MLFNSVHFLFFFIIVSLLYYRVNKNQRLILLFLSSCYFYMVYNPVYILILFLLILIDFIAGIFIESTANKTRRKCLLFVSIISNFGILFYFKYSSLFLAIEHFFSGTGNLFSYHSPQQIVVPIGLSFHTFQSVGYMIQVYRRHYPAEKNLLTYSNFVLFLPQLVAGPIEKPQTLLTQFKTSVNFDYERTIAGLYKIGWGLFKKVAIADRLAFVTTPIFQNIYQFSGLSLLVAVLFFGIQIYADFSGYSDIARGTAQVLGYNLSMNFRQPYLSTSLYEFWKRWHITLTNWFREYVYFPLGGNKKNAVRHYVNIMLVFVLSGLWHGANFTFIAWGVWHGLFYILENLYRQITKKRAVLLTGLFSRVLIMVIVLGGWIFFRANSLAEVQYIFTHLFKGVQEQLNLLWINHGITYDLFFVSPIQLLLALLLIIFLFCVDIFLEKRPVIPVIRELSMAKRWSVYYIFIITFCLLAVNSGRQFIYFRF